MSAESLSPVAPASPLARPVAAHRPSTGRRWAIAALLVVLCLLPFVFSSYRTFQLTLVLAMAIAVLGLNMLTGYNGQISLGHSAFYAIGAYVTAALMEHAGMPYWLGPIVAAAVCFVFGFLFGLPALRLEGHYLALATFALALATPQILKHKALEHWLGGVQGIVLVKPDAPFGLPLTADQWLYLLTLAWTIAMFVLAANLLAGRIGRAMVAVRDHPVAAAAMGIDTALCKSMTFAVSAMYTGIAGALAAISLQFVAPDSFGVFLAISFLVGSVVGGVATIAGAGFGALVIVFLPNVADHLSKAAPWAVYGAFLIVGMYLMPAGVVGLWRAHGRRWLSSRAGRGA